MMIEQIISIIAPHYCLGCDEIGGILCQKCSDTLPRVAPRCYACQSISQSFKTCRGCRKHGLVQVFCASPYTNLSKEVVRKLKFGRSPQAAKVIARIMASKIPSGDWLVVPIPTATGRVRLRGYDQAQLIAKNLSAYMGLSYSPLLLRNGQKRQVGQTRKQRREQIADSFILQPYATFKVAGRHILLVDDVVTTGATLEAASAALKASKPASVSGAAFAAA